jgi:predicted Fe-Mo cluster-binding NifX family protein
MIICIPSMDNKGLLSEISVHFGKSPFFTILDVKDDKIDEIEVIKSEGRHTGGKKTPAEIIIQSKPDVLLCANLGSKAIQMLNKEGVKIFTGASGNVENTFKEWKNDNLQLADEKTACMEGN